MECGQQCVVVNMTTILQLLSADSLDTTLLKVHLKEHCSTMLANTIKNAKIQRKFLHILEYFTRKCFYVIRDFQRKFVATKA